MANNEEALQNLLEALRFSPDNIPLRKHVADMLLKMGRYSEAEEHLRKALDSSPSSKNLKLDLANIFYLQDKYSPAFVIVEELLGEATPPPVTYMLHAKLLLATEKAQEAQEEYRKATALDNSLRDEDFEQKIKEIRETTEDDSKKVPVEYNLDEIVAEVERPKVNFSDVGGMDKVKEEIEMKIILPMKHPEMYKAYGKTIGGGILMYGPPGCGKTHLARATAGEVNAGFISVGINDVLDMWIGNSEKNLHQLFELARAQTPCVLFFDEVDALGASRTDMRKSGGRHLINQFLSEMDGIDGNNDGVLILAATNTPWHLDTAFRRPGRFDRMVFVAPPDQKARESILQILLKEKPSKGLNLSKLAAKTNELSGADLKALVDVAIESKLMDSLRAGHPLPIEQKDLIKALEKVRPTTKEWFQTAKNYALYANESGLYDDILKYLKM